MPRTAHQARVVEFMLRARQDVPQVPTIPDEKTRILRAKLMLEEVIETIKGLGVRIDIQDCDSKQVVELTNDNNERNVAIDGPMDLIEVVDGCADVSVVTIGTLVACGVHDQPVLEAVDKNNLDKFKPGHSWLEDGKLIKPPGHPKVDLKQALAVQDYNA